ncbi:MAG: hypothetical protein Aurels2KO_58410 [Aureliella sp.]
MQKANQRLPAGLWGEKAKPVDTHLKDELVQVVALNTTASHGGTFANNEVESQAVHHSHL